MSNRLANEGKGDAVYHILPTGIDGQFIVWVLPEIFRDGFESGNTGRWQ